MNRLIWCLLLLPGIVLAAGGTISQTFDFSPGDFVFDRENGYDVVALPGQYWTSEPGSPCLPLAVYNVLIPPDAEVTGVDIVALGIMTLPGEYSIHPAQRPQILSGRSEQQTTGSMKADDSPVTADPSGRSAGGVAFPGGRQSAVGGSIPFVAPNPDVYSSEEPYPAQLVRLTPSGSLGGYRIAGIQVTPLQSVPARKELRMVMHLSVAVHYESGRHPVEALDVSQIDLLGEHVRRLVRNPDQVSSWHPRVRITDDWRCDLMVITSNSLRSAFQPFVKLEEPARLQDDHRDHRVDLFGLHRARQSGENPQLCD